ncbi:LysR family transcriptional regulator [Bacillus litorisediminis]|uniref:LysR family transcriptional regulator n=1 Tax=Bacillus litorisediminis TaxID=2922713 RepID=UPI001FAFE0D9|nr:LysR family transcriptional regulator [Bacillus litorisediminis]
MNIEQLTYIIEVAHTKSLAKAAKTLNISQSALSQAITRLESELNLKIFDRNRTGAVTTKEGDKIIEKAQNALHAIFQIKEEARNQNNNLNELLRISTIPGLTEPIIDTYLLFKNNKTSLNIEVNEKGSFEIIEDVKKDHIDIGFIAINKANMELINELDFTPVLSGKIMVFASKDSPLASNKEGITTDSLKEQLFVLYKDEYVHEFIANFQRLYGPVNIFFKTTNLDMINKVIKELGAITIGHDVSARFNPNYPSYQMVGLDIPNFFDTSFRFGWIKKNDNKLSKEAKIYIEEVNKNFNKNRVMK